MKSFPEINLSDYRKIYVNYDCPWGEKCDVYEIPLSVLHLNKDNGRIASWVSGYERSGIEPKFDDMSLERWNETLMRFVEESSSKDETKKTRESINTFGQLKVGAITSDGTVIAGNRRCSILMGLLRDTGNHEKFGYFKCAVFKVANTEQGRKELKRLETRTQYGEDQPVAYKPIERLVDVYNSVIAPGAPYSKSEYQHFIGLKKSDIDTLVYRALILVDYLKYIGKEGNYEVARAEKLDGPINELARVYKKVGEKEWNRIKKVFFDVLQDACRKKGDRTREIRKTIKLYESNPAIIQEHLNIQKKASLEQERARLGKAPLDNTAINPITSASEWVNTHSEELSRQNAKRKALTTLVEAQESLGRIEARAIELLSPEERKDFFERLKKIQEPLDHLKDKE